MGQEKLEANHIPVTLTFDDCDRSQYNKIYPILTEFELKASFYIITNQISRPGKMTFEELITLYKEGNEIGSHTHTHPDLTNLSHQQIQYELEESKTLLKLFNCKTLAYPYGKYTQEIIESAKQHYIAARSYYDLTFNTNNFGYNPYLITERYNLNVFPTETIFKNHSSALLEMSISELDKVLNSIVNKAIKENLWSIFVFHEPNHFPSNSLKKPNINPRINPFFQIYNPLKKSIRKKKWIRNFTYICKKLANNEHLKVLPLYKVIELKQTK